MALITDDVVQIIRESIRDIPDFPKPGIIFKDVSTLLNNQAAFKRSMDLFEEKYQGQDVDFVVGIEARGFIFGAALADRLNLPFVPIRKPGKLPSQTIKHTYDLEYGTDTVEIHDDAFENGSSGKKVLIVDDLLATGGSAGAAIELIKKVGGEPTALAFVVELDFLKGREKFPKDLEITSLVHY